MMLNCEWNNFVIVHENEINESYETMKTLLIAFDYMTCAENICGALKVICFFLDYNQVTQSTYDRISDTKHYAQKTWPTRPKDLTGRFNCLHKPPTDAEKVLLPRLHFELGFMKNFVKAMDQDGAGFHYLLTKFKGIVSEAKVKAGVYNGPHIRLILNDQDFIKTLSELEMATWDSFVALTKNFLGNDRARNYEELVDNMLKSYQALSA